MTDFRDSFTTGDVDLASYLVATGRKAEVYRQDGQHLATFAFHRDTELPHLIEGYSAGSATISARKLLAARRRLFHQVRDLGRGGGI